MRLEDYIKICDLHVKSVNRNLKKIEKYSLSTLHDFENLTDDKIDVIDSFIMRFGQLQDVIGTSIFPRILEVTGDLKKTDTFIDKLNKLEKLEYLPDAQWWRDIRDLRNASAHDYPNEYEKILEHIQQLTITVPQLLEYWEKLKKKVELLIAKQ